MQLAVSDIKLREGKIKISGTTRTNERILSLHAGQMIVLQQYLDKNKWKTGKLFSEGRALNNRIKHLFSQLKKLNPKIINAKQLRSSVITEWLLESRGIRIITHLVGQ